MLDRAIALAYKAFLEKRDRAGKPAVLHSYAVMALAPDTIEHKIVAVLHDVIEDTDYVPNDLRILGYSERVVLAVEAISKKEGEIYKDFIRRCCHNTLAREVKKADLAHNMNRLGALTPKEQESLLERYSWACDYIREFEGRDL